MASYSNSERSDRYNKKVDVWGLGVTLIEIVNGQPPLHEYSSDPAMLRKMIPKTRAQLDTNKWSLKMRDFIQSCLKVEVDKRPTSEQLL